MRWLIIEGKIEGLDDETRFLQDKRKERIIRHVRYGYYKEGQITYPKEDTTDLNYWIKLLSCIIEANGGHIGLSHINLHWYY